MISKASSVIVYNKHCGINKSRVGKEDSYLRRKKAGRKQATELIREPN